MSSDLTVAVVGATGVVGRTMVRVLEERRFPVARLRLFATARSAGKTVFFQGRSHVVDETDDAVLDADVVLFAGGDDASRRYAWGVAEAGGIAIDNSSTWRLDPRVPLVVPEVNGHVLREQTGVIANPNCCAVALVMALKPIHDTAGVRRAVVATYQSVSGGGIDKMRALLAHSRELLRVSDALEFGDLARIAEAAGTSDDDPPVAFNVRPHWRWEANGDTEEEAKIVAETGKMLDPHIQVSVTTVRVPVLVGHTLALHLDLERPLDGPAAREVLGAAAGLELIDEPSAGRYPTPMLAAGRDPVFVGRIRPDPQDPRSLRMIVCSDNLRKGAALNAVQIAEQLLAAGRLRARTRVAGH